MSLGQIWIPLQCLFVAGDCARELFGAAVGYAEKIIKRGIIHSEVDSLAKLLGRFRVFVLLVVEHSQVTAQGSEVSLDGYRLFVICNGGRLVRTRFDETQLIPSAVILRVVLYCLLH